MVSGVDYVWRRVGAHVETIKQAPRHFCYLLLRSIFTKPWNSKKIYPFGFLNEG